MEKETMIPVSEFCIHYNIELSFIDSFPASLTAVHGLIKPNGPEYLTT